jgi:hypothetical protein
MNRPRPVELGKVNRTYRLDRFLDRFVEPIQQLYYPYGASEGLVSLWHTSCV